jgi:hypothetical protein
VARTTKTPARVKRLGSEEIALSPAEHNRRIDARNRLIQHLQRLETKQQKWPEIVRRFSDDTEARSQKYSVKSAPLPFQAPVWNMVQEPERDWIRRSDEERKKHQTEFLYSKRFWRQKGIDPDPAESSTRRGVGKTEEAHKRINSSVDERFSWTARYLSRGSPQTDRRRKVQRRGGAYRHQRSASRLWMARRKARATDNNVTKGQVPTSGVQAKRR